MNKNIKYSQNFLTSEKVLNQIIKQLNLKETDTVYEIGTGKGHLTTKLAAKIGIPAPSARSLSTTFTH